MKKFTENWPKYAPVVLRIGLAAVFFWFGFTQIIGPAAWTSLIPTWVVNLAGISATTFVLMNGIFEVCAATLLVFGFFPRIVSALLFLHIISIITDIGLGAIGVRDFGIAMGLLAIFLNGRDFLCWRKSEVSV